MNAADVFDEVQQKMGHLLDRMISKGMKPPAKDEIHTLETDYGRLENRLVKVNAWEPENE